MTYPRAVLTTWLLALLLVLALVLWPGLVKKAEAGAYLDVGLGATLFNRTIEDGTWIQEGLPNKELLESFAWRVGLGYTINDRWSLQANYLHFGTAKIRALVVRDPDYNNKQHVCLNHCGEAFPFNTNDTMYGGEVSLTRTWQIRAFAPFLRAGGAVMIHHLRAAIQPMYPTIEPPLVNSRHGFIPAVLVGGGVCYKMFCAETTYYQGLGGSTGGFGMDYALPISTSLFMSLVSVKIPLGG